MESFGKIQSKIFNKSIDNFNKSIPILYLVLIRKNTEKVLFKPISLKPLAMFTLK